MMGKKINSIGLFLVLGVAAAGHSQTDTRIVYELEGALYSIRPDGTDVVQLSKLSAEADYWDTKPAASPDGSRIAFTAYPTNSDFFEIWTMDADGSNRTQLTFPSSFRGDSGPVWSPNGLKIAFSSYIDNANNSDIFTINRDGTNRVRVTEVTSSCSRDCSSHSPSWFPDGRRIVYYNRGIRIMNADGTDSRLVTADGSQPNLAPDGAKIAFMRPDTSPGAPYDYRDIWTIDVDGTNGKNLTWNFHDSGFPGGKTIAGPIWSPDGSKIAFYQFFEFGAWPALWLMNADGTNPTNLGPGSNPTWLVPEHQSASWGQIKKLTSETAD